MTYMYSIKSKPNFRNWTASGQVKWRNIPQKIPYINNALCASTWRPSSFVRRQLSHFNLLLRNHWHWTNCNQTLVEWSLDSPLSKLCPVIPTSIQDGRQAKNRKKGGWNFKKIFSSETTEPILTKLCWYDHWVAPFQNCVRHFRPPTKISATAELNLT
jgi:hypothetical protein